jgi:hypothetical protein
VNNGQTEWKWRFEQRKENRSARAELQKCGDRSANWTNTTIIPTNASSAFISFNSYKVMH